MTQIVCQECEAELHGLDLSTGKPKCKGCGALVLGNGGRKAAKLKTDIEVPASIQVQQVADGAGGTALTVRVPWRLQNAPALTMLTYAWIIGLVLYLGAELEVGAIVSVLVAACVGGILFSIRMVNDTIIMVTRGKLTIRHGPLPWLSREIDARHLEQLYVDKRPLEQKKFDYSVRARVEDEDEEILLFRSLADPVVALYLEQCLEQHLHIIDTHVSGEFLPEHMHMPQQHAFAKPSQPSQPSQPSGFGSGPPPPPPPNVYPQHYSVPPQQAPQGYPAPGYAAPPAQHAQPAEQPAPQQPISGWPPRA